MSENVPEPKADQPSAAGKPAAPKNWDFTLAFWLLRGWLAVRAIVTGVEKYAVAVKVQKPLIDPVTQMEDPSGAMVEVVEKVYSLTNYHGVPPSMHEKLVSEPLMPGFMYAPFCAILGPLLILAGMMLLLGIATRTSLFVQGILYIMLTVGMILMGVDAGIAWLGIHVIMLAMALAMASHNRWCIWNRF